MARESLPIDEALSEIVQKLAGAGALVLKAEPGAGKTTRVPPAVLDAGLAKLADGRDGQIILLQPRRVAARSAAARIAEERGGKLGDEIGYQVRHEGRSSKRTRILVCTEGLFLRKLQDDPLLEDIAVVVFDEFHERTIDSDLALALVRQVREQLRDDLRVVVMSATLDPKPIAAYLQGCPTVEVKGRGFPIDIQYLQFPPNASVPNLVAENVEKMFEAGDIGHVLAFLPGVGEIRQTQELLDGAGGRLVMPLFGDMSLDEQQKVLRPSKERKIILATNVAETSITIDGVAAVVDSGLHRVNRFQPLLGLNRLETERISKASADQRAGRAGRTAAGRCLRLWTEREHHSLRDFDQPEIARVDLSQSILQLLAWGEKDIDKFPWFEVPPVEAVARALRLLEMLEVLQDGALTDLGRKLAQLPVQPRLARLLVEGANAGMAKRAALCAAILSERDAFRREETRRVAEHHSDSDVLDRMTALEQYVASGVRQSFVGTLMSGAANQVLRTAEQLSDLVGPPHSRGGARSEATSPALPSTSDASEEPLLRALLHAFPDRVCKRRQPKARKAVMVGGRGVRLSDESALADDADLFLAVELTDSGQSESIVRQASRVERVWLSPQDIFTGVEAQFDTDRKKLFAMERTRYFDLVLSEAPCALPAGEDYGAMLAEGIKKNIDISSLIDDSARKYLARVQCLAEWLPDLDFPDSSSDPWIDLLPAWCQGCTSVAELTPQSLIAAIQSQLKYEQMRALDEEAPESLPLPNGRRAKVEYEVGKPPVLAARIQEFFGMKETPRIARGRVPVLLHLLAPNYRVQQITPDLAGFWKNTYPEVKKELKGRYPKHKWPDDPLTVM